MEKVTDNSSFIASVAYSPRTATLIVSMKSGPVYKYLKVPVEVYGTLCRAKSAGRAYNKHVKDQYKVITFKH